MQGKPLARSVCIAIALAVLFSAAAAAQRRAPKSLDSASAHYLSKESSLQGVVVKFTAHSDVAPLGAHMILQAASGPVDVHLGSASFLKSHGFVPAEGSTVRVVGQFRQVGQNRILLARIVQFNNRSLAVRSVTGMPLWPAGTRVERSMVTAAPKTGAL